MLPSAPSKGSGCHLKQTSLWELAWDGQSSGFSPWRRESVSSGPERDPPPTRCLPPAYLVQLAHEG